MIELLICSDDKYLKKKSDPYLKNGELIDFVDIIVQKVFLIDREIKDRDKNK